MSHHRALYPRPHGRSWVRDPLRAHDIVSASPGQMPLDERVALAELLVGLPETGRVLERTARGPVSIAEAAADLDLPLGVVIWHLQPLVGAGLVEHHRQADGAMVAAAVLEFPPTATEPGLVPPCACQIAVLGPSTRAEAAFIATVLGRDPVRSSTRLPVGPRDSITLDTHFGQTVFGDGNLTVSLWGSPVSLESGDRWEATFQDVTGAIVLIDPLNPRRARSAFVRCDQYKTPAVGVLADSGHADAVPQKQAALIRKAAHITTDVPIVLCKDHDHGRAALRTLATYARTYR